MWKNGTLFHLYNALGVKKIKVPFATPQHVWQDSQNSLGLVMLVHQESYNQEGK